jgi:SagB-type dehydrogenase family enzyme
LTQGTYFYDSREHALRRISDYFPEESCYGEGKGYLVNRPVFLSSALGVILVAEMSTVSAVYGQRGLLFAALEAGELAHSLELEAAEVGLGACQIGHFAPDAFATAVKLSELDVVVHHLLFGVAAENEGAARDDWDQFEV